MKIFKLLIFLFVITSNNNLLAQNIESFVLNNISTKDGDFLFVFKNDSNKNYITSEFCINLNMIYFCKDNEFIPMGIFEKPNIDLNLKKKTQYLWKLSINENKIFKDSAFNVILWSLSFNNNNETSLTYLWKIDDKNQSRGFSSRFDERNSLNFKIAKLIGVNSPYSFAFIASNNTSRDVELPGFYSESCCLKVKFPDGKEFIYQLAEAPKNIKLAPGESQFVKFDITELLKNSKKFTLDNFNYGVSELIWEVKLLDGTIEKRTFKLLKTEKPLPEMTKTGQGWQIPIDQPIK
ncbi:MAG: hypothetical protein PHS31_04395 [Victivallaceae bacterium]|nr:hypothetical protein [Victivallaceae bacterium]